jgi:hypothetical protein
VDGTCDKRERRDCQSALKVSPSPYNLNFNKMINFLFLAGLGPLGTPELLILGILFGLLILVILAFTRYRRTQASPDTQCPGCGTLLHRDSTRSQVKGFNVRQSGG